ncbi:MAG: hypothetical protein RLY14_3026, partial [Planctomycetota bacterium]
MLTGWVPAQEIDYPQGDPTRSIRVSGDSGQRWDRGDYRIYRLNGGVRVTQGDIELSADSITLWIDRTVVPTSMERTSAPSLLESDIDASTSRNSLL